VRDTPSGGSQSGHTAKIVCHATKSGQYSDRQRYKRTSYDKKFRKAVNFHRVGAYKSTNRNLSQGLCGGFVNTSTKTAHFQHKEELLMPKGGARKGAGRKPTPLAEKLAAGNPGKRPLKKVVFENNGYSPATPPRYLAELEKKKGSTVVSPLEIYEECMEYLEPTGCLHLIPKQIIREWVMANYHVVEAHYQLSASNFVGLNAKGNAEITGYAKFMQMQQKKVEDLWKLIWDIVSRNSEQLIDNPEHDLLALILGGRTRKKSGAGSIPKAGE